MAGKATRRHWLREVRDAIRHPLSALEGKHGRGEKGLSEFRVILALFAIAFVKHWPASPWGIWDWAGLATIALALPVSDLFTKIPAAEWLHALGALAHGVMQKRKGSIPIPHEELP